MPPADKNARDARSTFFTSAAPTAPIAQTPWYTKATNSLGVLNPLPHSASVLAPGLAAIISSTVRPCFFLLVDTRVEGWDYTFPASPAGAIPSTVFGEDHTVHAFPPQ